MFNNIKLFIFFPDINTCAQSGKTSKNHCQYRQYDLIPGEMKMCLQQLANKIHVYVKAETKGVEHISTLVFTLA